MIKLRSKVGFTLIELIVVMIILAILSSIIVPQLTTSVDNTERAACMANQRTMDSVTAMWVEQDINNNKASNATLPVLASAGFYDSVPVCPSGGNYSQNGSGAWTCDHAAGTPNEHKR